jgi:hypothetical protein
MKLSIAQTLIPQGLCKENHKNLKVGEKYENANRRLEF